MNGDLVPAVVERPVENRPLLLLAVAPLSKSTKTIRSKVRPEVYPWLNQAAYEVNQVWNWANATRHEGIRRGWAGGKTVWLTAFDLNNLASGAGEEFFCIGSDTIQEINRELVAKCRAAHKAKLRFRKSGGSRKSLGWVPFKAVNIRINGEGSQMDQTPPSQRPGEIPKAYAKRLKNWKQKLKARACLHNPVSLIFMGKTIRLFNQERYLKTRRVYKACSGQFSQNALGEWFLNQPFEVEYAQLVPLKGSHSHVGIDPGLKGAATTSDGEILDLSFTKAAEKKIAELQKRGHKRQAKRVHRKVAHQAEDAIHQFTRKVVDNYATISYGDASSVKLAKTRLAKGVYSSRWGIQKDQLQAKSHEAGRRFQLKNERFTTQACCNCGQVTGPKGLRQLVVRQWTCSVCNTEHERDVCSAINMMAAPLSRSQSGQGSGRH